MKDEIPRNRCTYGPVEQKKKEKKRLRDPHPKLSPGLVPYSLSYRVGIACRKMVHEIFHLDSSVKVCMYIYDVYVYVNYYVIMPSCMHIPSKKVHSRSQYQILTKYLQEVERHIAILETIVTLK